MTSHAATKAGGAAEVYDRSMATLARETAESEVEGWSQAAILELVGRLMAIACEKGAGPKVGDLSRYYGISSWNSGTSR